MTLSEIEDAARSRYNAQGDTNWSSAEIATIVYEGCLEMSRDCGLLIEKRFESLTVAGTGEYEFPDSADSVKRITYNGRKLKEITMREDDVLTLENQLTTDTGDTEYYYVWDRTFFLRPIPQDGLVLEVFALCTEEALTPLSVLSTPEQFHGSLITYVVAQMSAKDLNWQMYDRYIAKWDIEKDRIRAKIRRSKRADAFTIVKSEEMLPYQTLGVK